MRKKERSNLQLTSIPAAEKTAWREQAEKDGFRGNLSLWLAWLAKRRIEKEKEKEKNGIRTNLG